MEKDDRKTEIILSQWQTCVEMANSVSHRRDVMNNLFVTLNIALIGTISLAFTNKTIIMIIAGIGLCVLWKFFINNFRVLNQEKFKIIHEIECELPFQAFKKEWDFLKNNRESVEGTKLELYLPYTFILFYVFMGGMCFCLK